MRIAFSALKGACGRCDHGSRRRRRIGISVRRRDPQPGVEEADERRQESSHSRRHLGLDVFVEHPTDTEQKDRQ
jgi:hypothetical protein